MSLILVKIIDSCNRFLDSFKIISTAFGNLWMLLEVFGNLREGSGHITLKEISNAFDSEKIEKFNAEWQSKVGGKRTLQWKCDVLNEI